MRRSRYNLYNRRLDFSDARDPKKLPIAMADPNPDISDVIGKLEQQREALRKNFTVEGDKSQLSHTCVIVYLHRFTHSNPHLWFAPVERLFLLYNIVDKPTNSTWFQSIGRRLPESKQDLDKLARSADGMSEAIYVKTIAIKATSTLDSDAYARYHGSKKGSQSHSVTRRSASDEPISI